MQNVLLSAPPLFSLASILSLRAAAFPLAVWWNDLITPCDFNHKVLWSKGHKFMLHSAKVQQNKRAVFPYGPTCLARANGIELITIRLICVRSNKAICVRKIPYTYMRSFLFPALVGSSVLWAMGSFLPSTWWFCQGVSSAGRLSVSLPLSIFVS